MVYGWHAYSCNLLGYNILTKLIIAWFTSTREKATVTLSCSDMNTSNSTWTYTGSPSSLVIGLDRVLKEGKCLIMTDPAMEQLMTVDKKKKESHFSILVELSQKNWDCIDRLLSARRIIFFSVVPIRVEDRIYGPFSKNKNIPLPLPSFRI